MSNASIVRREGTSLERDGFGSREVEQRHETASTAIAAQAQAEIQARYVMAMQRPRDDDNVRVRLLKECSRPNFAKRAFFSLPKGNKPGRLTGTPGRIEGLSVRFAEAAIRMMGNILQSTRTVYDDDVKRMINVSATDLETNAVYGRDIIIEKTVERSDPKKGAVILGQRTNSAGSVVYIVQSTEDELLQKESALVSKMFRTEALRLLPADTIEECEQRIVATVTNEDAKDPTAARKAVIDFFASLNVMPDELKTYLGHAVEQCSPKELLELRGLAGAIRDGEVTWSEALNEKTAGRAGTRDANGAAEAPKTAGASVAERVRARTAKQGSPAPAVTPAQSPQAPAQAPPQTVQASPDPGPHPPAANDAHAPTLCVICAKPVSDDAIQTRGPHGPAFRHPDCSPFAPAQREPGED